MCEDRPGISGKCFQNLSQQEGGRQPRTWRIEAIPGSPAYAWGADHPVSAPLGDRVPASVDAQLCRGCRPDNHSDGIFFRTSVANYVVEGGEVTRTANSSLDQLFHRRFDSIGQRDVRVGSGGVGLGIYRLSKYDVDGVTPERAATRPHFKSAG